MKKNVLILLLVCIAGCSSEAIPDVYTNPKTYPENTLTGPLAASLQSLVDDSVRKGLTGAALYVQTPAGLWAGAAGYISIESNYPFEKNSVSAIGSITKTFTSVIILQLAGEGHIDLDQAIAIYLTDAERSEIANADVATVRQCLNHTSGIFNYTSNPLWFLAAYNNDDAVWNMNRALSYARNQAPAAEPGGTVVNYSNTNYILLGKIAQKVTGKTIAELYTSRIIEPMQAAASTLESTFFSHGKKYTSYSAECYFDMYGNGQYFRSTQFARNLATPDGGMVSSVFDLAAFMREVVDGTILLTADSKTAMMAANSFTKNENGFAFDICPEAGYGLGLMYFTTPSGNTAWGHNGGLFGFNAAVHHFPVQQVTYSVLVNCSGGTSDAIISELMYAKLFTLLGL